MATLAASNRAVGSTRSAANVELIWLTQRFAPNFKTIANFRNLCRQFVVLCQQLDLLSDAVVAIDGSILKAVNSSNRNFTQAKLKPRMEKSRPISAAIWRNWTRLTGRSRR